MTTVKLRPTVIPRAIVRATVLGDIMHNFGIPQNVQQIAQQGFAEGNISGVRIIGYDTNNHIQDEVTLRFDELTDNADIAVAHGKDKTMVEALSVKFARCVEFSVARFQARGLGISYVFLFYPGRASPQSFDRYGLDAEGLQLGYAEGYAPRQLFVVRPGLDKGIQFTHQTAWRAR